MGFFPFLSGIISPKSLSCIAAPNMPLNIFYSKLLYTLSDLLLTDNDNIFSRSFHLRSFHFGYLLCSLNWMQRNRTFYNKPDFHSDSKISPDENLTAAKTHNLHRQWIHPDTHIVSIDPILSLLPELIWHFQTLIFETYFGDRFLTFCRNKKFWYVR